MVLDAPEIVKLTQCGQFVHIACGEGHLLRRPISICTWRGSHLRIVFQVKGDGNEVAEANARSAMCSTCLDRSDTALMCRHWATVRSLSAAALAYRRCLDVFARQ